MKLATLKNGTAIAVQNDHFVPLAKLGFEDSLLDLISGNVNLEALKVQLASATLEPLDLTQLATPIMHPPKIICVGLNYRRHALESGMAVPTQPVVFTRFSTTLNAPYGDVPHDSSITTELDYEVELAIIIGKGGKRIGLDSALEHIFGYTVCNDISARDIQLSKEVGGQWTRGKNVDGTCPIGPWIVTRDEIPDPQNLRLTCQVNGQTLQDSSTSDMIFSVQEIVSRLSYWFTLEAGDIIITGTPEGVGFARKPPIFLKPGDVTTAYVEGIGTLENRIVAVA